MSTHCIMERAPLSELTVTDTQGLVCDRYKFLSKVVVLERHPSINKQTIPASSSQP